MLILETLETGNEISAKLFALSSLKTSADCQAFVTSLIRKFQLEHLSFSRIHKFRGQPIEELVSRIKQSTFKSDELLLRLCSVKTDMVFL